MITLKLNDTTFAVGDPVDLGIFYGAFLSTLRVLGPTVEKNIREKEVMNHILEELSSLKITPIRKEDGHADGQAAAGENGKM